MKKIIPKIIVSVTLFMATCLMMNTGISQSIVINEILASNQDTMDDEDGESSDWIELYNGGNGTVNLDRYSLSDNPDNPQKWQFPNIMMEPGKFLIIWASGKDRVTTQSLHTNYKLSASGEFIGLYDPQGILVNKIDFPGQTTDVSYGRLPDGSDSFSFFQHPTPDASNQKEFQLQMSHSSGAYDQPISVEISVNDPSAVIYFTTDTTIPDRVASVYNGPISISKNTVLRFVAFVGNNAITEIHNSTYIIDEIPKLPILCLVTEEDNFWHPHTGIYVNYLNKGIGWEKPVHISLIDDDQIQFALQAGIRIHGNQSREFDKKSLRLYFRAEYGQNELNFPLFAQKPISRFKRLVLHSPGSDQPSGNYQYLLLRDVLCHTLFQEMGNNISAFKPVALYLNGEYWGLYWIREFINRFYFEDNEDFSDVDLLRAAGSFPEIREGDDNFWNQTLSWLAQHDMRDPVNYEHFIQNYVDIRSFTDYYLLGIYSHHEAWPHWNSDWYRNRSGNDQRWHWIMWDFEATWKYDGTGNLLEFALIDYAETSTPEFSWCNQTIRNLIRNEDYRTYFINRFADLMNTILTPDHVRQRLETLAALIEPEIVREMERWKKPNFESWYYNLDHRAFGFIENRRQLQRQHVIDKFRLSGSYTVEIVPGEGVQAYRLNTLHLDNLPWSGQYFLDVPVTLEAIPAPGYKFSHWSDLALPATPTVTVTYTGDAQIRAVCLADTVSQSVIINEINYRSRPERDPGDWVELVNSGTQPVDLSGWVFQDSDISHRFILPAGLILAPSSFVILCQDTAAFRSVFPAISAIVGNWDFGLSRTGERIALYGRSDSNFTDYLIDSVLYRDSHPWPFEPDGQGPTLELKSTGLDNALPESWQTSLRNGSPGRTNSTEAMRFVANDSLVIHEIYYQNSPSGDWFELYNASSRPIDISGWYVQDSLDAHVFVLPVVQVVEPDSYLVVCRDTATFDPNYPDPLNRIGNIEFGLGQSDGIRIKSEWGLLVDSVQFLNRPPWPVLRPDQAGSIELMDPDLDNEIGENWQKNQSSGTPGRSNRQPPPVVVINDSVVISEINYRSSPSFETGDWIELHNVSDTVANLSGWSFADSSGLVYFIFPDNKVILPDSFLVIWQDNVSFTVQHPALQQTVGPLGRDLSQRELIRLLGPDSSMIDSVFYDSQSPWPEPADGTGPTLEVMDPLKDNADPANWQASLGYGTPSRSNSAGSTSVESTTSGLPTEWTLHQNYPNPFNPETQIAYGIPERSDISIIIYNIHGEEVRTLERGVKDPGRHVIVWDGRGRNGQDQAAGIYLCRLKTKEDAKVIRMLKLK